MILASHRAGLSARALFITFCFILGTAFAACSSNQSGVETSILEYLKSHGAPDTKEVKIDLFHTDKQAPDKAYAGVTATYTFGSGSGELQREYLGYILKREGGQWIVEENTKYTKDAQKATDLLLGKNDKGK
jgi:hypothetical protein